MKMRNVYTVGQVNSYIRVLFTQDYLLKGINVRGEISNLKYARSGHIFFTLKEEESRIACVMFAGKRSTGLSHRLEDGEQVVVTGSVDVYEATGQYQLYADRIKRDGRGELFIRYEELKEKLLEMGMFDESYKRPIPEYVNKVGVVTAPNGAAIRDIIRTIRRHAPFVQIILYPSTVQGQGAAENIARGIQALQGTDVDVLIVGRGGGSIEDLWAFNEEVTAKAVFESAIPVISGVGHETDTTICDLVADLRASTPTAAAEIAVAGMERLEERLSSVTDRLSRLMEGELQKARMRVREDSLRLSLNSPEHRIRDAENRCIYLTERADRAMSSLLESYRSRLTRNMALLKGLSPSDRLMQGYTFTELTDGRPLTGVSELKEGMSLRTYFRDGSAVSDIREVMQNA